MRTLLAMLVVLVSAVFGRAQQRNATVQLDDGRVLHGTVVAMDLSSLQLVVDGATITLPAARIQSCHFDEVATAEPSHAAEGAPAKPTEPRAAPGGRAPPSAPLVEPAEVMAAVALDPEAAPLDVRHRSLLRTRIERLDEAYPWLCPAVPAQWLSLCCLVFALLTVFVHLAVRVCGAEQVSFSRCMGVTAWYMVTGFLQIAFVPVFDLTTVIMLIGNTALALFWMRLLFSLTRPGAVLALAVQLGFLLLSFGTLELADSVLKSVGSAHA
jgi:hypothetical protein